MKQKFINWVYNKYKAEIESRMLMDMYGFIPNDLKQPSIEFLINGKDKLERFFSVQAYEMQRRSIMDEKNAQKYQGMLIHIKSILLLLRAGTKQVVIIPDVESKPDPVKMAESFATEAKKKFSEKNK